MKEKIPFVINDMLVLEEFCNQKCDYCDTGKAFSIENFYKRIENIKLTEDLFDHPPKTKDFFVLASEVLERIDTQFEYPILKLSGGEIFLYNNLVNFLEKIHEKYYSIQLLTNGILLSLPIIEAIADLGNIYFQLSLDGNTLETNFARSKKREDLEKILQNISIITSKDIGLEINCVLTKYNTPTFLEFAKFMEGEGDLIIFPRPVRGRYSSELSAEESEVKFFSKLLEDFDRYLRIFPPISYFERVITLLSKKPRDWNCYVPFFVLGVDNYGTIQTCTCNSNLPTLETAFNGMQDSFKLMQNNKQYNPDSRLLQCSDCITQYELFNLYVEEKVTEKDLKQIPTFKIQGVLDTTKKIKEGIIK